MSRKVIWGQVGGQTDSSSTVDAILKDDYVVENIINTVNTKTYFLSRIKKERSTGGRRFVFPVRLAVGEGQGNRAENEDLPDYGFGEYEVATGNVKFQYSTAYLSGPVLDATRTDKYAFASALSQAIKDARDGFALDTHRQIFGDGSGTIALVQTGADSATQAVTSPYGLTYVANGLDASQKRRAFRRGMKVLFKTANQVRTIVGVGNGTIILDSAVNTTTGEKIIRASSTTLSNENKEYLGLAAVMKTTGSYLGIDRTNLPQWQGNIIDVTGNDLSEEMLQIALDTAENEGDGVATPDLLLSEHAVRRIYVNLLAQHKRFPNTLELRGGFKALDFNGIPWTVDRMCPPQRVYFLHTPNWTWMTMRDVGWLDHDGKILKWVSRKDAWEFALGAYRELVCKQPANQVELSGIVS